MNQTEKIVIDASGKSYSDIMIEVREIWYQNSTKCKIVIRVSMVDFTILLWECVDGYYHKGMDPKIKWEWLKRFIYWKQKPSLKFTKLEQRDRFIYLRNKRILLIDGNEIPVQIIDGDNDQTSH